MKTEEGVRFWPLHWIYHDQWQYTSTSFFGTAYYDHDGHMHFFMMGFDAENSVQQAYTGEQNYKISLQDLWSPRSNDVNQQDNFRIVGRPKWYFNVEEYWRRVYIQPWEFSDNNELPGIVGKRGIKYDASKSIHTYGPFREGKDNFTFFCDLARGLPIEYFKNEEKTIRDHYLRHGDGVNGSTQFVYNYNVDPDDDETRDYWILPSGYYAGSDLGIGPIRNPNENDARRQAYGDKYYLAPTLEYQKAVHLDWERLPGYTGRDLEDEETGEDFGDSFDVTISLPYKIDGKIQSPFSNDVGSVAPPGTYFHDCVPDANKLKYNTFTEQTEFDGPISGGDFNYDIPNPSWPVDGKWVEQFLGGIIQAKAKVILEDAWGGRFTNWVHTTQFFLNEEFEGKDQYGEYPE